jgi:hypothetical protein
MFTSNSIDLTEGGNPPHLAEDKLNSYLENRQDTDQRKI